MNIPDITAAILAEAEAATRPGGAFKLNVPDSAKTNKNNPRKQYFTEAARITGAKKYVKPGKSGRAHTVFELGVEVLPEGGSGQNIGAKFKLFSRVCFPSIEVGDKENGEYIMSRNAIARLKQLFDACGVECVNEYGSLLGDVLEQCFTEQGTDSPLVGTTLSIEIMQEKPETPDGRYNIEAQTYMEYNY